MATITKDMVSTYQQQIRSRHIKSRLTICTPPEDIALSDFIPSVFSEEELAAIKTLSTNSFYKKAISRGIHRMEMYLNTNNVLDISYEKTYSASFPDSKIELTKVLTEKSIRLQGWLYDLQKLSKVCLATTDTLEKFVGRSGSGSWVNQKPISTEGYLADTWPEIVPLLGAKSTVVNRKRKSGLPWDSDTHQKFRDHVEKEVGETGYSINRFLVTLLVYDAGNTPIPPGWILQF